MWHQVWHQARSVQISMHNIEWVNCMLEFLWLSVLSSFYLLTQIKFAWDELEMFVCSTAQGCTVTQSRTYHNRHAVNVFCRIHWSMLFPQLPLNALDVTGRTWNAKGCLVHEEINLGFPLEDLSKRRLFHWCDVSWLPITNNVTFFHNCYK